MQRWMGLLALGLSACSTTPTLYHTLNTDNGDMPVAQAVSQPIRSLGVGPVQLPTLLDREGLVIRQDAYTLKVSDTHLWGGQLEDELLNALSRQLQLRLPHTRVQTIPWESSQTPQYQIALSVERFDGSLGGQAVLRGVWQLQNGSDAKIVRSVPFTLTRAVNQSTVAALVQAQSQLVQDLAAHIVAGL